MSGVPMTEMTTTGLTPTDYTMGSTMTEPLIGLCFKNPDPDLWQPEPPNGRPSKRVMREIAVRVVEAKTICNSCTERDRCLEFGKEPNDLPYGIWGGKMAGERILGMGITRDMLPPQSDLGKALDFYERMKPYLEEAHSENQMG